MMKLLLWVLLGFVVAGIAFWTLVTEGPQNPLLVFLVVVIFAMPSIGAFWMLYMAIRYQTHPLPMMFLAFLPYAFLWYYLERVRPGKLTRRIGEKPGHLD
jgi:hypothetical protein